MFGKLLKYDFRSMLKQFAFVWPAALVLGLMNRFTINSFVTSTSSAMETISGITMLVYVAILMAMFIIAVIFVIQRFYKGLLGDEGYLMHTLPVKPRQLIGSKLVCAVVVTFVSILVAIASILLIVPLEASDYANFFRALGEMNRDYGANFVFFWVELLVFFLAGMAEGYLMLYAAMAIGHLAHKNRVLWSVVAYIAINTAVDALTGKLVNFYVITDEHLFQRMVISMGEWNAWHTSIWTAIAVTAVLAAVFYVVTSYILGKKLNLE